MTILTLPAQPSRDAGMAPLPWRRMVWVTWRQHRATLISVPAVLGGVALFLLPMGLKVHHDYAVLAACHGADAAACENRASALTPATSQSTRLPAMPSLSTPNFVLDPARRFAS